VKRGKRKKIEGEKLRAITEHPTEKLIGGKEVSIQHAKGKKESIEYQAGANNTEERIHLPPARKQESEVVSPVHRVAGR